MKSKLGAPKFTIDAKYLDTRSLNRRVREAVRNGHKQIALMNITGQRYIAAGLQGDINIDIFGTPGNDLGAFMDGPRVAVHGNGQDGLGNTMNDGKIIIHGDIGDITGLSARGGQIFIRGDAGYRTGVHMKEHHDSKPIIAIGGTAQDFLGEYMAGGIILILGLTSRSSTHEADFVGTGMHGGVIYVRGEVKSVSRDVEIFEMAQEDNRLVESIVKEFSKHFDYNVDNILAGRFKKLVPSSSRPYGNLYTY